MSNITSFSLKSNEVAQLDLLARQEGLSRGQLAAKLAREYLSRGGGAIVGVPATPRPVIDRRDYFRAEKRAEKQAQQQRDEREFAKLVENMIQKGKFERNRVYPVALVALELYGMSTLPPDEMAKIKRLMFATGWQQHTNPRQFMPPDAERVSVRIPTEEAYMEAIAALTARADLKESYSHIELIEMFRKTSKWGEADLTYVTEALKHFGWTIVKAEWDARQRSHIEYWAPPAE